MAEGKEEQEWWHTASLMAMVVNMLSSKGKVEPAELHPMLKKKSNRKAVMDIKDFGLAKDMLKL